MRPLTITIEGFRSFKSDQAQVLDFDGIQTAAVIGDTGSGKSSILEALTWVLFGETSRGAKMMQHLTGTTTMDFEWSIGEGRNRRVAQGTLELQ